MTRFSSINDSWYRPHPIVSSEACSRGSGNVANVSFRSSRVLCLCERRDRGEPSLLGTSSSSSSKGVCTCGLPPFSVELVTFWEPRKANAKKKKEPPPSKPRPPPSSSAPPPARISPARPAARWSRLTIRPLNRDIFWSLEFYLFFCWSITYLTFVELELFAPLQWLFDSVFLETDVSMATVRMWLLSLLFFSWWIEFHFSIGISIGFSLSFF